MDAAEANNAIAQLQAQIQSMQEQFAAALTEIKTQTDAQANANTYAHATQPVVAKTTVVKIPEPPKYGGSRNANVIASWIFMVTNYTTTRYPNDDRSQVIALSMLLKDAALNWFRTIHIVTPFTTVASVCEALKMEFYPVNQERRLKEQLHSLTQTSSVDNYTDKFRAIRLQLDLSDEDARDYFIRGLRDRTRLEVEYKDPSTLREAVQMAQRYDDIMYRKSSTKPAAPTTPRTPTATTTTDDSAMDIDAIDVDINAIFQPKPKLTETLKQELRAANKCFFCRRAGHTIADCKTRESVDSTKAKKD